MQKIAINTDYGGFSLSDEALQLYKNLAEVDEIHFWEIERDDAILIQIIEQIGERASGDYSTIEIVEVPYGVKWHLSEYDGIEWIAENHRTWSKRNDAQL